MDEISTKFSGNRDLFLVVFCNICKTFQTIQKQAFQKRFQSLENYITMSFYVWDKKNKFIKDHRYLPMPQELKFEELHMRCSAEWIKQELTISEKNKFWITSYDETCCQDQSHLHCACRWSLRKESNCTSVSTQIQFSGNANKVKALGFKIQFRNMHYMTYLSWLE